ncbi:MAG TPA: hypothetical protein VFL42_07715, partial [Terriglobales bacterium]|nr:hypothetical protein [Terriglobales bacterium]
VGQLGDIAGKENIQADDQALAVLAEAGDGSMRDALSIMDQAIACCGTTITGAAVRDLVGDVGSEVLEELMATVARNSSEDALWLLDKLMNEGHNPAHFARQLVRFLRNSLVARVAGENSPVLQISSDERARAARVAGQFSEEDLARFLQIMLRTYDETGYRQEQRFHLELGVLKLVHAQRILPLEQVLSQTVGSAPVKPGAPAASSSSPDVGPEQRARVALPHESAEGTSSARPASPFEVDRARKGGRFEPEMSHTAVAGDAASPGGSALAVALEDAAPATTSEPATIFGAVLAELEEAGHKMLASTLEQGSAQLQDGTLIITVAQSASVIEVMMGAEPKRLANAAATRTAGSPVKVNVIGGAPANGNPHSAPRPARNGASARSRAAEDPVVQRMQEQFGADIRTVIDYREKR